MHGSRAKVIRVNARVRSDCFGGIQRRAISLHENGIEAVTDDCVPPVTLWSIPLVSCPTLPKSGVRKKRHTRYSSKPAPSKPLAKYTLEARSNL